MRKPGTKRGGRVPWLPGVKQEGREPKQDSGGAALQAWARGDSYSDTGSSAASAAAAAAAGFNAAAGPGPPTLPWTLTPRHSPTCCVPAAPPRGRPPNLKSSEGNETARPLPGTPDPSPTCAGGGELSSGAGEANRSAASRIRPRSHFPAPRPRLAKFAGNLPGRAPTGPRGSARVHRAGGGGRRPRVLAAPEGPPGPAALAPPLRPPAPPAR